MPYWLAQPSDRLKTDWIRRFDPRFWSVNFPRPMIASVVTTGPASMRVDAVFLRANDLAGIIWESEDRLDHPLLAYATKKDYRGLRLTFRWQASGTVKALDATQGPTLTIEGRTAGGVAKTWYVRLWNYAQGTPTDAIVRLDFDAMNGGFALPAEADPVWAGDIDRMFLSVVPPSYDGVASAPLATPAVASVTISQIDVDGADAAIEIGDVMVPEHDLRMANGYDDTANVTPARLLRNWLQLGYRRIVDHYVGMSHFMRLAHDSGSGRYLVQAGAPVLNAASAAWHQDLFTRAHGHGFQILPSVSFEIFDAYCPDAWRQRDHAGGPALTGWTPPSSLISPTNTAATNYIRDIMLAFLALMPAGMTKALQIGEPWWWIAEGPAAKPCFYDTTTTALYTSETGQAVPTRHVRADEAVSTAQGAYLDWLAAKLAAATLMMRNAIKAAYPSAQVFPLIYLPQIVADDQPLRQRANLPTGWAHPAFDRVQLEDYGFVTANDWGRHALALGRAETRLGYARAITDYFAGFVLNAVDRAQWSSIHQAILNGRARGFADIYVWAYSQVARDGFAYFELEEEDVPAFHDVQFPVEIGYGSTIGPRFSTTVTTTASGYEQRNVNWAQARLQADVGTGVRSEADVRTLMEFFHARRGRAFGFRFRDPLDLQSAPADQVVAASNQHIGVGDGARTRFPLLKWYGSGAAAVSRRITRPIPATVRVALNGIEQLTGWTLVDLGQIDFAAAPAVGVVVSAGFQFDVPMRFAEDALAISLETFRAGEVPSVSLIEIRDA